MSARGLFARARGSENAPATRRWTASGGREGRLSVMPSTWRGTASRSARETYLTDRPSRNSVIQPISTPAPARVKRGRSKTTDSAAGGCDQTSPSSATPAPSRLRALDYRQRSGRLLPAPSRIAPAQAAPRRAHRNSLRP